MTKKPKHKPLILIILTTLILALALLIYSTITRTFHPNITTQQSLEFDLPNGLSITKIGSYTGPYMEDASDEEVGDVMAILVTNNAENALQYAEIMLTCDSGEAVFKLSTLNPGESVMVLEAERKIFDKNDSYTEADSKNVVFFDEPLNTYEDLLSIQPLDGGFNVTNISGERIDGDIVIYFKDYEDELLCGGITYRGRIEGGMEAGEIRQVMSSNFSETGTKVMFITIIEE